MASGRCPADFNSLVRRPLKTQVLLRLDYLYKLKEMAGSLTNAELLVMSALLRLDNHAYGVPIVEELERYQQRISVATVYVALNRLEAGGLVASALGEATRERGGRARRYFRVTAKGLREVRAVRRTLIQLWHGVPQLHGGTT